MFFGSGSFMFRELSVAFGFVPDAFGHGVTVPVIKDRLGDASSPSNYRPITLSPVISKTFEYCILHTFEHFFLYRSSPVWFQQRLKLFSCSVCTTVYQCRWPWMSLNCEMALILRHFTEFGNGPYFVLFYQIRVRRRRKTIVRLTSISVADPGICGPGGRLPHYWGFAININRQCTGTASSGCSKAQNLSDSGGLLWPLTPWTGALPLNAAGGSSRADWVDMLSSPCSRRAFYHYNGFLSPFLLLQYQNKETAVS